MFCWVETLGRLSYKGGLESLPGTFSLSTRNVSTWNVSFMGELPVRITPHFVVLKGK